MAHESVGTAIAGSVLGTAAAGKCAAAGACTAGPFGAIVGGVVGWAFGKVVEAATHSNDRYDDDDDNDD